MALLVERPDPRGCRRAALPLLLVAWALGGSAALASSPEAWRLYDLKVRSACVAASGLTAVRARGSRLDLPTLGLSSLLLEGRYPQAHMNGSLGLELCVFEQRSGRAAVTGADSLLPALGKAPPAATPAPQR
jgi:hypothetical protein